MVLILKRSFRRGVGMAMVNTVIVVQAQQREFALVLVPPQLTAQARVNKMHLALAAVELVQRSHAVV